MTEDSQPYRIQPLSSGTTAITATWDNPAWQNAQSAPVSIVHQADEAPRHVPTVVAQCMAGDDALYLRFKVDDQYVRAVHHGYQSMVCKDSCVEFFFQPRPDRGYFNLEVNCGGQILLYYNETDEPFEPTEVALQWMSRIEIAHSLPERVEPEITEPVTWVVALRLPRGLIEAYVGPVSFEKGAAWRGNFYKCGDETSHPHWQSWWPLGPGPLNFHRFNNFGPIVFT